MTSERRLECDLGLGFRAQHDIEGGTADSLLNRQL